MPEAEMTPDNGGQATIPTGTPEGGGSSLPEPNLNEPAQEDDWGASREAFFDGDDIQDPEAPDVEPEVGLPDEANGEDGSHLEAGDTKESENEDGQGDDPLPGENDLKLNLDDSRIPHKYRDEIHEKTDALVKKAIERSSEEIQAYKGSTDAYTNAFVDIIKSDDPVATLRNYAKDVVEAHNLSPEILTALESKMGGASGQPTPPADSANTGSGVNFDVVNQKVDQVINQIHAKYDAELNTTDDPVRVRQLLTQESRDINRIRDAVAQAQTKELLKAYHNKMVQPGLEGVEKLNENSKIAEREAVADRQVSSWNSAESEMRTEFKDWDKYKGKVKELIKGDGRYSGARRQANETGEGHKALLTDLYHMVARNDHLNAAKEPKLGSPGFKPGGKHIKTQKAGGSDWDSIGRDLWSDVNPDLA
jgi:hypothetical protein